MMELWRLDGRDDEVETRGGRPIITLNMSLIIAYLGSKLISNILVVIWLRLT
jgi:hypothetical protein